MPGKGGDTAAFGVQEQLRSGVPGGAGQVEDAGVRGDAEGASSHRAEAIGVGTASRSAACALPWACEGVDAELVDRDGGEFETDGTTTVCAYHECARDNACRGDASDHECGGDSARRGDASRIKGQAGEGTPSRS